MNQITHFVFLFIFSGINAQINFDEPQLFFSGKKFPENAKWMLHTANAMTQVGSRGNTINTQADSVHHYIDYGDQFNLLYRYHLLYAEVNGNRLPVEIRGQSGTPGDNGSITLQYDQNNRIIRADFFQQSDSDTDFIGYYENRFDSNGRLIFRYFDIMMEPGENYIQGDSLFVEYDEFGRDSLYRFYMKLYNPDEWEYIITANNFEYDVENNLTQIEFFRDDYPDERERYSEMLWYGGYANQIHNLFLFNDPTLEVQLDIANDILPEAEQTHRKEPIHYNKYYQNGGSWELTESRELISVSESLILCDLISFGELAYKEEFRIHDNLLLQYDAIEYNSENDEWEIRNQIINRYNDYGLIEEVHEFSPSVDISPRLNFSTFYEIDPEGNLMEFEYLDHNDEFRRGTYFYNTTSAIDLELNQELITLSPNPAGNKVSLLFSELPFQEFRYRLLSINGNVVQSGKLQTNQNLEITLDQIPPGLYFFHWFGQTTEGVVKLIRE